MAAGESEKQKKTGRGLIYRALVEFDAQQLAHDGISLPLTPGMQVTAGINLGTRSVRIPALAGAEGVSRGGKGAVSRLLASP
ncbi:MAG: hypothetical protein WCF44_07760 [Candidatus Methylophosphatis roskildensis]|mgnify:FL=1|uniref:Uncharacterized protein n=1 Tax=Candidatus Methylophosphatis roskildensis TaxID=2899263 RepID=A0A9D7HNG5_9PROT|nr:hypothetical protein [Candidatus Methylophosphatis roskildensis]MBK7236015.1 hypothetical protein [Sterolibacteriaceae bacterium]